MKNIVPKSHGEPLNVYFDDRPLDSYANPLLAPTDWCVGPHLGNRNAGQSTSRNNATYFLVGGSRDNHRPLDSLACHPQTAGIDTCSRRKSGFPLTSSQLNGKYSSRSAPKTSPAKRTRRRGVEAGSVGKAYDRGMPQTRIINLAVGLGSFQFQEVLGVVP
jgi:hypothetical protein